MNAIHTESLTKQYGKARGIVELDLTVNEGEFFGFIGPNGAGKSTTIRTLLGLINPTSGSASVLGKDIVKERTQILEDIGYLPSEAVFYPEMRVKEVLTLSAKLRRKDCSAYTKELCERLQLDTSRKVDELSFGNRKKVGIVSALAHQPKLLILDEPTSGLDPLMQREFFSILQEQHRKGTTIFLSSHILSEIEHNCGRAAIIREGHLIACDKVENLSRTNAHRVTLRGDFSTEGLVGVKDLIQTRDTLTFLYGGDMNTLIARLSQNKILDLTISEPDLEEIFMHYYTEGGEQK